MDIEVFELERRQSIWENFVKFNLTESGIHPYTLSELLDEEEITKLLEIRLGYGQTNGSIELREAICQLYSGSNIDNVLVTNGSAEANFIAIWSILKPQDELILMLPNYMQIWGLARSLGIKVVPFYLKSELDWQPDLEEIKNLVTPNTRMISVCNPNNPTGSVLTEGAMNQIVKIAKERDLWIHADEVYRGAELQGEEIATFWGKYDKVIINCGLSKAYALPGLRIGWSVGPEEYIEKAWSYSDYTTITTGVLSNRVGTVALQPNIRQNILNRNRNYLRENLTVVQDWVKKHSQIFSFIPPKAGGIVFLKYDRSILDMNSTELTTKLREEKSVLIVAGDCFGMDNHLRIGIGSEREFLIEGLNLISEFVIQYTNK